MRVLIGFVGTAKYNKVPYRLGDKECTSSYSFVCLYRWFSPNKVYIFSTQDGFKQHGDAIKSEIPEAELVCVEAPSDERDIWDIHRKLGEIVNEGDEIILDITFSFRHIPLILFSTLIYMMEVRNVKVHGVYYGSYTPGREGDTPIIDVTGSIRVVEWLYSVMDMSRYGRSHRFQKLAIDLQREMVGHENVETYGFLSKIAGSLNAISDSIYLNQNITALKSAYSFGQLMERGKESIDKIAEAYPPVRDAFKVVESFSKFGVRDTTVLSKEILEKLLLIAKYQLDINLVGEALETLREWLISYVIWICNDNTNLWLKREVRKDAQDALGALKEIAKGVPENSLSLTNHYKCLKSTSIDVYHLANLWDKVTQLRNSFAHAGMNENKLYVKDVVERSNRFLDEFKKLLEVRD